MIVKAALLLFRKADNGQTELLFARAHNRPYYIFPGGKQEEGEAIEKALSRELEEEMQVGVEDVKHLGIIEGETPDGRPLQMHLFSGKLLGVPIPSAEIEEITWMSEEVFLQHRDKMTPMTLDHVLPFLRTNGLWHK